MLVQLHMLWVTFSMHTLCPHRFFLHCLHSSSISGRTLYGLTDNKLLLVHLARVQYIYSVYMLSISAAVLQSNRLKGLQQDYGRAFETELTYTEQ